MNRIDERYFKFLRIAVAAGSVFAWCLSIWWSSDGFQISVSEYKWLGVGLGLFVTISELLFNRGSTNPTIWIVGLFAYAYGYGTNIAGIKQYLGLDVSADLWGIDFMKALVNSLIIYGLGAIVEIAPESYILWAINPDRSNGFGDFITSLFSGSGYKFKNDSRQNLASNLMKQHKQQIKQQGRFNKQNKTFGRTKQTKQYPYKVNWTKIDRNTNIAKVLLAYREYWNEVGRDCPNKVLVKRTGVSKGQVSSIVSKLKSGGFA